MGPLGHQGSHPKVQYQFYDGFIIMATLTVPTPIPVFPCLQMIIVPWKRLLLTTLLNHFLVNFLASTECISTSCFDNGVEGGYSTVEYETICDFPISYTPSGTLVPLSTQDGTSK